MKKTDLQAAINLPQVPFVATLAAMLVMAGFRLVPEDLWDALSNKLDRLDIDSIDVEGLTTERNHVRGETHEVWQALILTKKYKPGTWVIPCDELLELKEEGYCDFVSVTRYMCTGTEEELRAAVDRLLSLPDEESL